MPAKASETQQKIAGKHSFSGKNMGLVAGQIGAFAD